MDTHSLTKSPQKYPQEESPQGECLQSPTIGSQKFQTIFIDGIDCSELDGAGVGAGLEGRRLALGVDHLDLALEDDARLQHHLALDGELVAPAEGRRRTVRESGERPEPPGGWAGEAGC